MFFFFNDTATTEIYTLSLHDALPISGASCSPSRSFSGSNPYLGADHFNGGGSPRLLAFPDRPVHKREKRSEEHTSELQSRQYLVCRLLLEKKNKISDTDTVTVNAH